MTNRPKGMSLHQVQQALWEAAAIKLGWEWSSAHDGYIRSDYLKPNTNGSDWDNFPSEISAEDACFIDGIETFADAGAVIG